MWGRNVLGREQHRLRAGDITQNISYATKTWTRQAEFCNYSGDADKQPEGLFLTKHGIDAAAPFHMHFGEECYDSEKGKIPEAALADDFWTGTHRMKFWTRRMSNVP